MNLRSYDTGKHAEAWELVLDQQETGRMRATLEGATFEEIKELVQAGYRSVGQGKDIRFEIVDGDHIQTGKPGDYLLRTPQNELRFVVWNSILRSYEVME